MEKCFELNPYDICVSSKMVNSKQFTLVWYVDENKVSHMGEKLVEGLFSQLKNHLGELLFTWVKKHTYWGISL